MPRIVRSAIAPYPASDMYRMVKDIEAYPEFLPWCSAAEVQEESATHQVASVVIAKSIKQSRFTTRNRLEPDKAIHVTLVNGPFRHLEGHWVFTDIAGQGCRAELEVDFSFSSRLLGAMIGPAFTRVCDSLVDAFLRRAATLYGKPAA